MKSFYRIRKKLSPAKSNGLKASAQTEPNLEQLEDCWHRAEWEKLASLTVDDIASSADRDRIGVLVACAHAQLGAINEAQRWLRLSRDWGCSTGVAVQALISGIHNSLGRLAALRQDMQGLKYHFQAALSYPPYRDTVLASHSRAVREMVRNGLLLDAATLISEELDKTNSDYDRGRQQARIDVLRSELQLVREELRHALMRGQLSLASPCESETPSKSAVARRSVSQLGQDLWVLERTNYKRNGFFVEFGATDGVSLSNTYLLEKEFAWNGLCAEPNPEFFVNLEQNRRCQVSQDCIGAQTGEKVDFVFADVYGGFIRDIDGDAHAARRRAYLTEEVNIAHLTTISLDDYLRKYGAPKIIDYISMDTEGSELEILSKFPFENWDVRNWTIEHNFGPMREQIRLIMSVHGYQLFPNKWDDWFYREDLV